MKDDLASPWWKGARGEWHVAVQLVLMALVFFGPRTLGGVTDLSLPFVPQRQIAGVLLILVGFALGSAGAIRLGRGLTPLPYPRENAPLAQGGAFALVRHPMYAGGLLLSLGVALVVSGWLTYVYAAALFVLADVKSRQEERWLVEKFPDYPAYQRRVRRLIPVVY